MPLFTFCFRHASEPGGGVDPGTGGVDQVGADGVQRAAAAVHGRRGRPAPGRHQARLRPRQPQAQDHPGLRPQHAQIKV